MRNFYIRATTPKWSLSGKGHPFPIVAWAIRLVTRFDSSHVSYDFIENSDMFHVYFNDIRFEPSSTYYDPDSVVTTHSFKITLPEQAYCRVRDYCRATVGKRTGYFVRLFGIFLDIVFGIRSFKMPKWVTAMTCSEHVAVCFREKIGIPLFYQGGDFNATEKDIVLALEKNTGKDIINKHGEKISIEIA